ncbi:MAG: sterol desaturase family protein [Gammaproteobacteria bacterium]|nr:sterol desaturase family protein [Gammaproteobacteria bacterium]
MAEQSMNDRDARGGWRPAENIKLPPIYAWPLRPLAIIKWFVGFPGYLWPFNALVLLIAVFTWTFLTPGLGQMKALEFWWIGLLLIRNLFLTATFFGGLHVYLYKYKKQGDKLQFSNRPFAKNKNFHFGDQVRDNMFRTLCYAVPIVTVYEAATYWLFANGLLGFLPFADNSSSFWIWLVVLLLIMPVVHSTHFYFTHRLLHSRPLYKRVHRIHHFNIEVGPFSGLAMHPVELAIYFSTVCVQWILALHPLNALYQLQFAVFNAAMSHTGYDKILMTDDVGVESNSYFHYLHHKFFECNYGGTIAPMDQLFGTFHNGSMEAQERMQQRMRDRLG